MEPSVMIFLKVYVTWTGVLGQCSFLLLIMVHRREPSGFHQNLSVLSSVCFISFHVSVLVLAYILIEK